MRNWYVDLANQVLFTDPETGEELMLKYEPQKMNDTLVIYLTNYNGSRNWKHTIKTEEI